MASHVEFETSISKWPTAHNTQIHPTLEALYSYLEAANAIRE